MLPAGEWDSIPYPLDLDEDPDEDSEDSFADDLPFNAEHFPGFSDGHYPDCLMQRMLDILPEEILDSRDQPVDPQRQRLLHRGRQYSQTSGASSKIAASS